MSKLQKSAWFNLAGVTIIGIIGMAAILFMARMNTNGIEYVLISIFVPLLLSPGLYIYWRRRSIESRFDEREKLIHSRSLIVAAFGLAIFLACVCIIPFFVLGGQNAIKVYYLPLIFFSALFIAQFVHSAAIIVQCALEEENHD